MGLGLNAIPGSIAQQSVALAPTNTHKERKNLKEILPTTAARGLVGHSNLELYFSYICYTARSYNSDITSKLNYLAISVPQDDLPGIHFGTCEEEHPPLNHATFATCLPFFSAAP